MPRFIKYTIIMSEFLCLFFQLSFNSYSPSKLHVSQLRFRLLHFNESLKKIRNGACSLLSNKIASFSFFEFVEKRHVKHSALVLPQRNFGDIAISFDTLVCLFFYTKYFLCNISQCETDTVIFRNSAYFWFLINIVPCVILFFGFSGKSLQ